MIRTIVVIALTICSGLLYFMNNVFIWAFASGFFACFSIFTSIGFIQYRKAIEIIDKKYNQQSE